MDLNSTPVGIDPSSYRVQEDANFFALEKPELGKNEFMTLLVAQLSNQDPLEPVKDSDFIAQLATFSSLEELQDMNTRMDGLLDSQLQMVNSQSMNLVGREVYVDTGGEVQLRPDGAEGIVFDLLESTNALRVEIYDENGAVVRTINLGEDELGTGRHRVDWDGMDENGNQLDPGMYSFSIHATDSTGSDRALSGMVALPVEGLNVGAGGLFLISGNRTVSFEEILEIRVADDEHGSNGAQ